MQAKNLILPPILSRRPHHPKQHTPDEIKLISNMRRRNPHAGLVVFCVKLRQRVQVHVKFVPGSLTVSFQIHFAELQYAQGFKPSFFVKFNAFLCSVCSVIVL